MKNRTKATIVLSILALLLAAAGVVLANPSCNPKAPVGE